MTRNTAVPRRCSGAMTSSCDQAGVLVIRVGPGVERPMCAVCRAVARLMGMVR